MYRLWLLNRVETSGGRERKGKRIIAAVTGAGGVCFILERPAAVFYRIKDEEVLINEWFKGLNGSARVDEKRIQTLYIYMCARACVRRSETEGEVSLKFTRYERYGPPRLCTQTPAFNKYPPPPPRPSVGRHADRRARVHVNTRPVLGPFHIARLGFRQTEFRRRLDARQGSSLFSRSFLPPPYQTNLTPPGHRPKPSPPSTTFIGLSVCARRRLTSRLASITPASRLFCSRPLRPRRLFSPRRHARMPAGTCSRSHRDPGAAP